LERSLGKRTHNVKRVEDGSLSSSEHLYSHNLEKGKTDKECLDSISYGVETGGKKENDLRSSERSKKKTINRIKGKNLIPDQSVIPFKRNRKSA